jgi:hypothetical protein
LNNPASSSTVQAVQSGSSSTISSVPSTPTSNPVTPPLENGIVNQFDVNGIKYHVLKKQSSSLAQAQSVCGQIPGSTIGGITSDVYQAVTSQLQRLSFANSKVIIGSWNGDSYSMSGGDCMILQLNNGIYPGQCSEASAILCQSW